MKFKYIKRGLSAVLATTMLLNICGCSQQQEAVAIEPMEVEEVYSLYFDALGGKDVMPITGYYGPLWETTSFDGINLPELITDDVFQKISDCGINMIHHLSTNYNQTPELVYKTLELGEKYNVGICVTDDKIRYSRGEDALTLEEVDERLNCYQNYPAFVGAYIVDEPGSPIYRADVGESRYVEHYQSIMQNLGKLGVFGSVNQLTPGDEEREALKEYLDYYCTNFSPMNLSWDYYLFDKNHNRDRWFYSLDTFAEYGDKYKLPQWVYVQAGAQWNDGQNKFESDEYFPTEGELFWNVNILLASGVKGIMYFPLVQPHYFAWSIDPAYDFQRNGLIGAAGNKTQWWYYAKEANAQVAAVDHVLMNSVCKGVITTCEEAEKDMKSCSYLPMEGTSWRELADVKGNAYIGCFNYQGKTALYVVNYETKYAQKITLDLQDSYDMTVIQNAEESHVNANKLTLDMKAGEGALIVFE